MDRRFIHLSIGLVVCTLIAAGAWTRVKLQRPTTIDVRGSAKRRISSDLAQWTAVVSVTRKDRVEAYAALKKDSTQVIAFLLAQGVPEKQLRSSAVSLSERSHVEQVETGAKTFEKTVFDGWLAEQHVEVSSTDVPLVERLSREATQLLEKGVVISSQPPRYHYTKLGELKVQMLGEAAKDARERADRMLSSAGGAAKVSRVEGIDTGVININAANSTETSWEGNYDLTSVDKDILTTVRVRFAVQE
jgi:uncharacterized protein